ncbi:uncharacterized protein LOC143186556 [Calliopsis andreniformis]|uniref:uncharacterized protein LOC143186556 n=1 Tax=Calliopsis andreniformis TaxID=337506 RepID=UPI003FCE68E1
MRLNELLDNLRETFYHPENVLEARRRFEARTWKKEESFSKYLHQKVILGNRVPINDEKIKIKSKGELLAAFERISLRGRFVQGNAAAKPNDAMWCSVKTEKQDKKKVSKSEVGCFNWGDINHLSVKCPVKRKGSKCFACNDFGHKAADYKKGPEKQVNACTAVTIRDNKIYKSVIVMGKQIIAFLGMGSDLHLMTAEQNVRLGCPLLISPGIQCEGFRLNRVRTMGSFYADVEIDGNTFRLLVHIVPNVYLKNNLLIGCDLLEEAEILLDCKDAIISKRDAKAGTTHDVPDIFCIDTFDESGNNETSCAVNLQNVKDHSIKHEIENLINNYEPKATIETNIMMEIVLKDDTRVDTTRYIPRNYIIVRKSDYYRLINQKVQDSTIFSVLDLKDGFFHVPIEENSCKYTTFIVPDEHYEFLKVPFGFCNAPAIFQKFIRSVFRDLIKTGILLAYMDDIIVPARNEKEALLRLQEVLSVASDYRLRVNWKKCQLLQHSIEYLGHIIEDDRVRPSKRKTLAAMNFPLLKNIRDIETFLRLTSYFRKFIPQHSVIASPLSNLLKKDAKFEFNEEQRLAFQQLMSALVNEPILKLYRVGAQTELHTDVSSIRLGALLLQKDIGCRIAIY